MWLRVLFSWLLHIHLQILEQIHNHKVWVGLLVVANGGLLLHVVDRVVDIA